MPTRKISDPDWERRHRPCMSPDHSPPSHMFYSPGVYEHVCSGCGAKCTFTVCGTYMGSRIPGFAGSSVGMMSVGQSWSSLIGRDPNRIW